MESLRFLLMQNQSYLCKLRARAIYCTKAISSVEFDTHKLYGPFSGHWDEWVIQAENMRGELQENITTNAYFLTDLHEFILTLDSKKKLSLADKEFVLEVRSLATDKLRQQKELIDSISERIFIHRQLTQQLALVEAIDSLGDE